MQRVNEVIGAIWSRHDKPHRWQALREIHGRLSDDRFYPLFVAIWSNCESNHLNLEIIDNLILERNVCAKNVMPHLSDGDNQLWRRLRNNKTVYRGTTKERPHGDYSWTKDRRVAIRFAKRCSRETPLLLEGIAAGKHVLFAYAGRNEAEIAIKPEHVRLTREWILGEPVRDERYELFAAVQQGKMGVLCPPERELELRLRAMVMNGTTAACAWQSILSDIAALEDMGFEAQPERLRKTIAKVDRNALELFASRVAIATGGGA